MEPENWKQKIRIEHLWGLTVLAGAFIFMNLHPIRPNDFWFHITYGRDFIASGQIPLNDTFSFTMAGQPYESNNNYLLAQAIMYLVYKLGGAEWIVFFFSLLITLSYSILFSVNLKQTSNWRAAALSVLFAISFGIANWNIRPQLFAYFYAALLIWAIQKYRRDKKGWNWILILFFGMVFWVNSHGTFFIPFLLAGFLFIEDGWSAICQKNWRLTLPSIQVLGLLSVSILFNPRGFLVIEYLLGMFRSSSVQQYVSEWQPPSIFQANDLYFFVLFGLFILVWIFSRYRPTIAEGLSFLVFALLAFQYERGIVWFGITQSRLFALIMQEISIKYRNAIQNDAKRSAEKAFLNFSVIALIFTLAFCSLPWFRNYWPLAPNKKSIYAKETPIQAVNYMQETVPPGNVFSDIAFSGYISWETRGEFKVFLDPRFELYPPELWEKYLQIGNAEQDWDKMLSSQDINILMLSPTNQKALIMAAHNSPTWEEIYTDESVILLARKK